MTKTRTMNVLEPATVLVALLLLLGTAALPAQDPTKKPTPVAADPEVDALLQKLAARRGVHADGEAASLHMKGPYEVRFAGVKDPVAKGTFEEWFTAGGDAFHQSNMGPMGSMQRGVQKDLVWEVDPHLGAKVRRGVAAAQVKRYCALLHGDDARAMFTKVEKAGAETFEGQEVVVLAMHCREGGPDTWRVTKDGTLVCVDTKLPAPESADAAFGMADLMDTRIVFADWVEQGRARMPKRRAIRMGQASVEFVAETLEIGTKPDAAVFTPPKSVLEVEPESDQRAFDGDGKRLFHVVPRTEQPTATVRVTCKVADISKTLAEILPEVMNHLMATGAQMSGPPFSRYHAWTDTEVDLEAGFPVQNAIAAKGRIQPSQLPAGRAVTCWHQGPYDGLTATHKALAAHLLAEKLVARGGQWEVYWTDPGMVPDPAKWKTQLFAPIE